MITTENILVYKMRESGIPNIKFEFDIVSNPQFKLFSDFISHKINLIIVGEKYYEYCAHFMKMKLFHNMNLEMLWLTQSHLNDAIVDNIDKDTLSLIHLYTESVEYRKRLAGAIVNKMLRCGKVLIGIMDTSILDKAFPYDIETIEHNFEVWKI